MTMKEAFRYQNKLGSLTSEGLGILGKEKNVTKVQKTTLQSKVVAGAEDVTVVEIADSDFADQINEVVALMMFLLDEREKLTYAIREAKAGMAVDFDGEVALNTKRQEIAKVLQQMNEIRSSEVVYAGGGTGYKFNSDGNQVSYRCDLKKVVSINFDRNKTRSYASGLTKKADKISSELDKAMVNTEVNYEAPFDVNSSFAEVLAWHMEQAK